MIIKFWGVRGSIPVPGKDTVKYGGNTTCIEVITSEGNRLIFDAGTGIRALGNKLCAEEFGQGKGTAHILFTHSHWDHIQGFPFFAPVYVGKRNEAGKVIKGTSNKLFIYGASEVTGSIEATLRGQMVDGYFPVSLNDLAANFKFNNLNGKPIKIGKTKIYSAHLRHPNGVLGYRIEDEGNVITIATDCEHPEDGTVDENLLKLAENADLLIYDGQYTPQEYEPAKFNLKLFPKKGFGHSTAQEGIKAAVASKAKRLVITHHEPMHDDKFIASMEKEAQKLMPDIIFAKEGMEIVVKS